MDDSSCTEYVRRVYKSATPYWYMYLSLEYENKGFETDILQFKHIIMQALNEIFGQVGASETVDVLKLSEFGDGILRVPTRSFVKLWSALTLFGKYRDEICAFRVKQVSPNLMSLSCNSRNYIFTQGVK